MKLKKLTLKKRTSLNFGGLSSPSKMYPFKAYSIPAQECIVGSLLAFIIDSICSDCFARKGRYLFENVKGALYRRFRLLKLALKKPEQREKWISEIVNQITRYSKGYFRWFDSGDLYSLEHLKMIIEVCQLTPTTMHWLPSKMYPLLKEYENQIKAGTMAYPDNLVIRTSPVKVDASPPPTMFNTSTVHLNKPPVGHKCPITDGGQSCTSVGCVAIVDSVEIPMPCWSREVENSSYPKH